MADKIQVNYETLEEVSRQFSDNAIRVDGTRQLIQSYIEQVSSGGWIGEGANAFLREMNDEVMCRLLRLIDALDSAAETVKYLIRLYEEAENEAGNHIKDGGDSGGGGGGDISTGTGTGWLKQWLDSHGFTDSDWVLMKNAGFDSGELLNQIGGSCTIYGIMNLLVQEGVDISPQDAQNILNDISQQYGRSEAFPLDAAKQILDDYGVEYTVGGFGGAGGVDRSAAEQFLIGKVSTGDSVYVWTETDDTFGIANAGHAYTVMGVNTDASGKLEQVMVSTNWDPPNDIRVLSADDFMDDWMNYASGRYVTVP